MEARRVPRLIATLVALASASSLASADAGASAAADEASVKAQREIAAVLQEQVAAWNAGDLERFCAPYSDDAAFAAPSGVVIGRAAILARYQKKYRTAAQRGTLALEPLAWTKVGADGWALIARWSLRLEKKPQTGTTALVFRRSSDGRWEIVQDASF